MMPAASSCFSSFGSCLSAVMRSFGTMAVSFLTVAYRHEKARLLATADA
jgi:hypothetical protein